MMGRDRPNRLMKGHSSPRLNVVLVVLAVLVLALPAGAQLKQKAHRDGWILAVVHAPDSHGSKGMSYPLVGELLGEEMMQTEED